MEKKKEEDIVNDDLPESLSVLLERVKTCICCLFLTSMNFCILELLLLQQQMDHCGPAFLAVQFSNQASPF